MVKVKSRRFGFAGIFSVAVLVIFAFAYTAMASGVEIQITSDSFDQFDPYISGDKIVWDDWRNTNNPEIYIYDVSTNTETRITDNSWGQYAPFISGEKVFWTDFRAGNLGYDIYMYDLVTHLETNIIKGTIYFITLKSLYSRPPETRPSYKRLSTPLIGQLAI